ncbi:ribbon-helix-helix protein, CopG family [uncultured Desulfobacter sp.]|uniref:CopG family ribbon-helix-helix protein n=1 Tax=uncultured Desulfobacter sp. TaxID=240139 RepID=UPI0029F5B57A|nr:ribbon-helix-helix protein, CopG family [uncultured Desulfobacter sp.]
MKATTVRIEDNMLERIDRLAQTMSRPRSWVIKEAISRFVEYEEWFVKEVKDGLQEVEQGETATAEEIVDAFGKWGVDAR